MRRFAVNHKGAVGEIGIICNHGVIQPGTIGNVCNHHMENAAPKASSVVNHNMRGCAREEHLAQLLGVWLYPGRVLGSTHSNDIVQFHPDLKPGWDWIVRHYQRVGIDFSQNVIWDDSHAVANEFPSHKLSTFFFGEMANEVRPDPVRLKFTKRMNSKNEFIQLAQKLGVPTPLTVVFDCKSQIQDVGDLPTPCVLKISESVSGLGVVVCHDREMLEKELESLEMGVVFQIQEYLDGAEFPSVQYGISEDGLMYIVETCNILEGAVHCGNWGSIELPFNPASITAPLAKEFRRQGMKGWFSFDTAFYQGRYYVLECNPRYTGASYPYNIAKKLDAKFWHHKGFPCAMRSIEQLDLGELEFGALNHKKSGNHREGWILVNWGPLAAGEGKGGFLYVGLPEKLRKSEDQLMKIIS